MRPMHASRSRGTVDTELAIHDVRASRATGGALPFEYQYYFRKNCTPTFADVAQTSMMLSRLSDQKITMCKHATDRFELVRSLVTDVYPS